MFGGVWLKAKNPLCQTHRIEKFLGIGNLVDDNQRGIAAILFIDSCNGIAKSRAEFL
jgi:hypothetical protein